MTAGALVSNRKMQNGSLIPSESWVGEQYKGDILPRLQQAVDTAFKYAQNGNISLLDPHLDTIAEIVIQYPQFRYFVKYKEALKFPKSTYFDATNGGMTVTVTSSPADPQTEECKDTESPTESAAESISTVHSQCFVISNHFLFCSTLFSLKFPIFFHFGLDSI